MWSANCIGQHAITTTPVLCAQSGMHTSLHCVNLQAALDACRQLQAKAEQELQQCSATASSHSATAGQAAAAAQAELDSLRQQLSTCHQDSQAVRSREEEARNQAKQLAAALTAAQADYQVGNVVM